MTALSVPPVFTPLPAVDMQGLQASIDTVKVNLSLINDTLSQKIQWTVDDINSEKVTIYWFS